MYSRLMRSIQCALFLLFPLNLFAISVVPFSGELDLTKQTSYKFRVSNPKHEETAVKISVQQWAYDENGVEQRSPSSDLLVFPKRMLLEARGQRNVRVSFKGNNPPLQEKAYRIIIEEVPFDNNQHSKNKKRAAINILTRYVTAFYVKPRAAKSAIKVIESQSSGNGFFLKIRNEGNAHTHFIQPTMTIRQANEKLFITDLEFLKPFATTNIFSLSVREYEWEIPKIFVDTLDFGKPYTVSLDWICENCNEQKNKISFVVD